MWLKCFLRRSPAVISCHSSQAALSPPLRPHSDGQRRVLPEGRMLLLALKGILHCCFPGFLLW